MTAYTQSDYEIDSLKTKPFTSELFEMEEPSSGPAALITLQLYSCT